MIEALVQGAELPPREVEGVNEEFCDCKLFPPSFAVPTAITCPVRMDEKTNLTPSSRPCPPLSTQSLAVMSNLQ
jgi:hypothetical protein